MGPTRPRSERLLPPLPRDWPQSKQTNKRRRISVDMLRHTKKVLKHLPKQPKKRKKKRRVEEPSFGSWSPSALASLCAQAPACTRRRTRMTDRFPRVGHILYRSIHINLYIY